MLDKNRPMHTRTRTKNQNRPETNHRMHPAPVVAAAIAAPAARSTISSVARTIFHNRNLRAHASTSAHNAMRHVPASSARPKTNHRVHAVSVVAAAIAAPAARSTISSVARTIFHNRNRRAHASTSTHSPMRHVPASNARVFVVRSINSTFQSRESDVPAVQLVWSPRNCPCAVSAITAVAKTTVRMLSHPTGAEKQTVVHRILSGRAGTGMRTALDGARCCTVVVLRHRKKNSRHCFPEQRREWSAFDI